MPCYYFTIVVMFSFQICPLVANAITDMNPQLKTLNGKILFKSPTTVNNYVSCTTMDVLVAFIKWILSYVTVLAKVDKDAEIEYSLVESPAISKSCIDFSLKVRYILSINLYS